MGKSWVLSLLTVTIMLGLVWLLALTSESVHRPGEAARPLTPSVEPETGPTFQRNGLMLTY
jgi:hypothetical protein